MTVRTRAILFITILVLVLVLLLQPSIVKGNHGVEPFLQLKELYNAHVQEMAPLLAAFQIEGDIIAGEDAEIILASLQDRLMELPFPTHCYQDYSSTIFSTVLLLKTGLTGDRQGLPEEVVIASLGGSRVLLSWTLWLEGRAYDGCTAEVE